MASSSSFDRASTFLDVNRAVRKDRYRLECGAAAAVVAVWLFLIGDKAGGPIGARNVSDVGLALAALAGSAACITTSVRHSSRYRWVWLLLGLSAGSWGIGQIIWTYYEVVAGRQVPFPSFADLGYLTAVPLAVAGLLLLPFGSQTVAGRLRMLLDGLLIAASIVLVSWELVLGKVFAARTGHLFTDVISLAYPVGDVVIVTIVAYASLRSRQLTGRIPLPLLMVGFALVSMSVADSGFAYLTATNNYTSGNLIDTGWFVGFLMMMLAARSPFARTTQYEVAQPGLQKGLLLPYVAVAAALITSTVELSVHSHGSNFVGWNRSIIIALLVGRQILTVRENVFLTKDLERRLEQLKASEQRFEALVSQSSDVVILVDATGQILYLSESVLRHFGYPAASLRGYDISKLFTPEGLASFDQTLALVIGNPDAVRVIEVPVQHRSGCISYTEVAFSNMLADPNIGAVVLNIRDINERKALADQLLYQARHDPLTELANRTLFSDHLQLLLNKPRNNGGGGTILFLDLDGFKKVNDSMGHAAGDRLIAQVAKRLRACIRPGDVVARLGGDEFGIAIEGMRRRQEARALAARILNTLNLPFQVDGAEVHVRVSIGIADAEPSIEDADQLLRNADLAMYRAKTMGGGMVEQYHPEMHTELVERIEMEADLRRAIVNGELVLNYQPILSLATGSPTGVEALMRWNHPTKGLIPPGKFIGVAEQTGLIHPIGRWVLHEACRQAAILHESNPRSKDLTVSVNISARQLQREGIIHDVAAALQESGLRPENLVLEMTESVLIENNDNTLEHLSTLRGMGIHLALDDFGTGYSSLAYLHRFPVDMLKIDRTFIARLAETSGDLELVRSILQIGASLRMTTVAEGIETAEQSRLLQELGCEFAQGFHLALPMAFEELDSWLHEHQPVAPVR